MFYRYFANIEFLLGVLSSIVLALCSYFFVKNLWKARLEDNQPVKYKAETFRNPINLSVTVAGLVIPLISGVIAYLLRSPTMTLPNQVASLLASLFVLTAAVFYGLYLCFSIAGVSTTDDSFTIAKTLNWKFPAAFVAQLVLLFCGIFLVLFFALRFEPLTAYKDQRTIEGYEVLRKRIFIGISKEEVIDRWGVPDSVKKSDKEEQQYIYRSPTSVYTITLSGGAVISFVEQKASKFGDTK